MWEKECRELKRLLDEASYPVFFGGAGVSTESGIPDFRGTNGVYTTSDGEDGEAPEYLLSHTCLAREPEKFYRFYRKGMLYPDAQPNAAHLALAMLEKQGRVRAVITQNIDGLHQAAGSRRVYELHGSTERYYCTSCGKRYGREILLSSGGIPHCETCHAPVRPDVVLYEEGLDNAVFEGAAREIEKADLLIVGGTSLLVNPAAWLVASYRGKHLVIVNYSPTPYDALAETVIRASVGEVLMSLAEK